MKIALGAWGLGRFAASYSRTWSMRFGGHREGLLSLPPMSSVHAGMVEPFPFVLGKTVYMDAQQFEFLTSRREAAMGPASGPWAISPVAADLLREFARAGVVEPVDFCSLARPHIAQVVAISEAALMADGLPSVVTTSRSLWLQFLASPGGASHPALQNEIQRTLRHLASNPGSALFAGRLGAASGLDQVPVAALQCGHDVFDAVLMLKVGELLEAAVCDWQMYGPTYRHCIVAGSLGYRAVRPLTEVAPTRALEWFIPIPKGTEIDDIIALRDNPYVRLLRDRTIRLLEDDVAGVQELDELWEIRRELSEELGGTALINPYTSVQSGHRGCPAFVERLGRARPTPSVAEKGTSSARTPGPGRDDDPPRPSVTMQFNAPMVNIGTMEGGSVIAAGIANGVEALVQSAGDSAAVAAALEHLAERWDTAPASQRDALAREVAAAIPHGSQGFWQQALANLVGSSVGGGLVEALSRLLGG